MLEQLNTTEETLNLTTVVRHLINDSATPEIFEDVPLPSMPQPTFTVNGLNGHNFVPGTPAWQAANAYMTLVKSLNYIKSFTKNPFTRWAATGSLHINPRAGNMANAYYDRQ